MEKEITTALMYAIGVSEEDYPYILNTAGICGWIFLSTAHTPPTDWPRELLFYTQSNPPPKTCDIVDVAKKVDDLEVNPEDFLIYIV